MFSDLIRRWEDPALINQNYQNHTSPLPTEWNTLDQAKPWIEDLSELPKGWTPCWDRNLEKYYFVQESTGTSQWEVPSRSPTPTFAAVENSYYDTTSPSWGLGGTGSSDWNYHGNSSPPPMYTTVVNPSYSNEIPTRAKQLFDCDSGPSGPAAPPPHHKSPRQRKRQQDTPRRGRRGKSKEY